MKRWAGHLVVLAATLLLLELVLRQLLGGAEQAALYEFRTSDHPMCIALQPGASVDYTGWFLEIPPVRQEVNRFGYRGPERPRGRTTGVFRLVALGDSYTYGMGVETDQSIPAHLEASLRRRTGEQLEVLNFGVPGAALADCTQRLRHLASRWKPDLVLFFLYADDLQESFCHWSDPDRIIVGLLVWKSYLARTLLIAYRFLKAWVIATGDGSGWHDQMSREVDDLARATERAGARLALVVLGDPSSFRRSPALPRLLASAGVPHLDARAWLFGSPRERLPTLFGETHFTPQGNRIAAERVAAWLVEERIVPISPRTPSTEERQS